MWKLYFLILFRFLHLKIIYCDEISQHQAERRYSYHESCGQQKLQCDQYNSSPNVVCNQNSRVIGGSEGYRGEFPWAVLLVMSTTKKHFCAATILDEYHVITANHCIFDFNTIEMARLRLMIGEHNTRTALEGRHEERRVSHIYKHPKWSLKTNEHDIAIIRMRRPINFTSTIQPICISGLSIDDLYEIYQEDQILATIVGWGRTNVNKTDKSHVPIKAVVPLRDHDECQKMYLPYRITPNMLCFGGNGVDACVGDSGGPIMIKDPYTQRWELIGITSWGNSCKTLPGVYTKLENYWPWIYKTIQNSYKAIRLQNMY